MGTCNPLSQCRFRFEVPERIFDGQYGDFKSAALAGFASVMVSDSLTVAL
jgi:hypothetical protein